MMVKVKHFLVLLNVGMAVVCLVALGVLQEKFSRPLYRQRFAKYSVPKHKALAVIQDQDSATMLKSRDLTVLSHQIESEDPNTLPETKLEDLISSGNPYVDLILTRIVGHQSQVQEEPSQQGQFNNLVVSPIYPRIVIYNRVPKCASATMWRICRSLSQINEFTFNDMKVKGLSHSELSQQKDLADWIFNRTFDVRHFFFKHIPYLNFTRFGYWEPTWINIVRHPVKRLISHYYFKGPLQTLDTCIETGVCNFEKNSEKIPSQIIFFCGYSNICRTNLGSDTLQMAKQVVESVFVVVGLQEDLPNTLLVLEHLIPTFFSGATKIQYESWNIQTSRPPTSNSTLATLERGLSVDMEFYYYLKQRFYKQLERIKELHYEMNSEIY